MHPQTGRCYFISAFITMAVVAIEVIVRPYFESISYIFIYPIIVLMAHWFGFWASMLSLSLQVLSYFFYFSTFENGGHFGLPQGVRMIVFLLCGGTIAYFITRAQNTATELGKVSQDLSFERAKLAAILEQMPAAVWVADYPSGKIILGNALSRTMTKSPESLPQDWPLERIIMNGESIHDDVIAFEKEDGSHSWVRFDAALVRNSQERNIGAVVIGTDITSQKMAEEQFETLANAIPQLAWMAERDGSIFWFNQRWYEYTGKNLEEMKGLGWRSVHHPDFIKRVEEKFFDNIRKGTIWEDTFPLQSRSGEWRWFLSRAVPVFANGVVTKWFGTNTDITEAKNLEKDLHEAIHSRDEFLSIASHELKTPLTSLTLQTQMIIRAIDKGNLESYNAHQMYELMKQTEKHTKRLNRLVDNMLDISRIQSGKLSLNKDTIDLCRILRHVIELHKEANLEVEIRFKSCSEAVGSWDEFRIEQVFSNILSNAIMYGNKSPIDIEIEAKNNGYIVSIRDHGPGIEPENLERIFLRYERAISVNEVSGLGLGLYICQKIVEAHEGKIWAESSPGKGSTFKVFLPI